MQSPEYASRIEAVKQRAHGRWDQILAAGGVDERVRREPAVARRRGDRGDGLTGVREHRDREPGTEPGEEAAAADLDAHLSPAAFLIAVRIRVYVPQRQMLPAIE